MKVNEFIEEYKKANDKEKFVLKHIVENYIPYEEKITICKNIIDKSNYKEINGVNIYSPNTPMRYMLFVVTILKRYTDIDIEENILDVFNQLSQNNVIDIILAYIPKQEYDSMEMVLNMCKNDFIDRDRSLVGYFDAKFQAFQLLFENSLPSVEELKEWVINYEKK